MSGSMSGNNIPPPSFGGLSGPTIRRFLGGFVQTSLGGMPFAVNGMLMLRTDGLNQATAIQDMDMDTRKNTANELGKCERQASERDLQQMGLPLWRLLEKIQSVEGAT